jgi:GTPase SAR1 family protein
MFPNFRAILDDFSLFFELLSKGHVARGTYRVVFDSIHENRLVLDRDLTSAVRQADNVIVAKSGLAFDIEQVFARFFSSLTGDEDPEMLIECFVETRESRVADFSLERLTKNVLGNIDINERDVGIGLKNVVTAAIGSADGQTIFIVGPSGAGKSTFLDRFFERTLTSDIRARCVVIKIDTLDVSGDGTPSLARMTEAAINIIEQQLFAGGSPTWNDLQALYHTEYVKRSNGVDSFLYKRDKNAFKEKFALYVEEQVERDRESYLRRLLADIVKNRRRLPVFVVDNTDEFDLDFKVSIFQYFQSLRRSVGQCLLIFPVTERSAWTFSRTEVFNIYSSRSFFLPTPSPREVFRKRVEYIRAKTEEAVKTKSEHIATGGIRIKINNLEAFAEVVETVFVNQDCAAKRVGELSNYNMREALRLAKRVITSSVFNLEDLVRSYVTNTVVAPSPSQFSNALLKGDYTYYKAGEERLLHSIFQVDSKIRQSPLLQVRILTFLRGVETAAGEDIERYMTVASVTAYFGVMAVPEAATQKALETLLLAGLGLGPIKGIPREGPA